MNWLKVSSVSGFILLAILALTSTFFAIQGVRIQERLDLASEAIAKNEMDIALIAVRIAEVKCNLPEDSLRYLGHTMHTNGLLVVYVDYEGSSAYSFIAGTMECSLGKG